jgi:hypothetical protein
MPCYPMGSLLTTTVGGVRDSFMRGTSVVKLVDLFHSFQSISSRAVTLLPRPEASVEVAGRD